MSERKRTILVADDDATICEMVGKLLTDAGYEVLTAADGEEALKIAHTVRPDLIVLDLMMPNVNGFTVVREIRVNPRLEETPILILTGTIPGKELNDSIREYGISGFISKTNMLASLVQRVQEALSDSKRSAGGG